ncbi:selenocysteine lyase/cysteine desulfurase [Paraburkholderia sp. JPY465]
MRALRYGPATIARSLSCGAFGLEATVRPSLAFYNTPDEVDRMVAVVKLLAKH